MELEISEEWGDTKALKKAPKNQSGLKTAEEFQ